MQRERVLGAAIAALVVGSLVAVAIAPGVVAAPERDVRPGHVDVREVTIAAGTVTGSTATLSVTTVLRHRGGTSENLSLRVRAVDLSSGLVATTRAVAVEPIEGDREVRIPVNLSVEREGGYRIEAIVYRDGRRVAEAAKAVRGVGSLRPDGAEVRFQWAGGRGAGDLPPVYVSVADVGDERVRLSLSAPLTNEGTTPSDDLRLEFVVRQADSNLVAATASTDVGSIPPGETVEPSVAVTVPDGYNYYVDAILRDGGVIVASTRGVVNLDPQERISANVTVRDVGLEVSDFEREERKTRAAERTPTPAGAVETPGFGIGAAAIALVVLAFIARRHRS